MRTELLSAYAPEAAFPCHTEETVFAADVPLHTHQDFTEITFVRGGSALCRDGAGECLVRRGDVLTAAEGSAHAFLQVRDLKAFTVRFRLEAMIPGEADIRQAPGFGALFLPHKKNPAPRRPLRPDSTAWLALEDGMDAVLAEIRQQRPGWKTCLRGWLQMTLLQLCRLSAGQSGALPGGGAARALAYLEDHYTEEIPLAELARVAGVSPRHLDRVFAQAFHFTPRAYIARLRMARARALLRTDRPITEIAFDCGYADSNYFSQVFRRHTGMSPQQYRRETMK